MSDIDERTISWSELDTYRQCPKKWDLGYAKRYSKAVADDTPLGKGVLWHSCVETRYRVIMAHQRREGGWDVSADELEALATEAVEKLLKEQLVKGFDPVVIGLMRWMYAGYVETYGLDESHRILGVESAHVAPLGMIEVDGRPVRVMLKFKIDRTVRDEYGAVKVIDEKSHAQLPSGSDYDFMDQFGLYVWGLRALNIDVRGAIHSASKTKQNQGDLIKPGDPGYKSTMRETPLVGRYKRTPIPYTKQQLEGIAGDALADAQQMFTTANHRRRHTDGDRCKWRCQFTEACLFGRRTGKDRDTIQMLELQGFTQNHERH